MKSYGIVIALLMAGFLTVSPWMGQYIAQADEKREQWVATWGSAPQLTEPNNLPPTPGLTNNTLRQIVHVSLGGDRLRLRFSNAFGKSPIVLSSVHLAASLGSGAINPVTDKALSFRGQPSVTIRPGTIALSDSLDFSLPPLSDLAVTIAFGATSEDVTGHPGSRTTSYLAPGSTLSQEKLLGAIPVTHWYILSGVDIQASTRAGTVAVLGDSITDGRGTTTDKNTRWPDFLARRLQANKKTREVAVLNQGIGGNRVLGDGLGPSALSRLDRDVLSQPGVRWLVVLEGINDLGTAPAGGRAAIAQDLIAAYDQIIVRAHDRGIKVYGVPILACGDSFYFSPELEAARQTVNQWIRTGGRFDAVIDMDVATRDPQNPLRLQAVADSGDHLHLNDKGYEMMANAVDLNLFSTP